MKKCAFCKRSIMGKSYMGMCPKCFNNFMQILFIVFLFVLIPVIAFIVTIFTLAPLSSLLGPFFPAAAPVEIVADVALVIAIVVGAIVGYGIVIFRIVRLFINNKKI